MSRTAGVRASTSRRGSPAGVWLREIAIVVVGALIASTLLRVFFLQMFVIPSGSMQNTLQRHDRVAVQKVVPFQRGDVVVFRDTQDWLGAVQPEDDPLRRILIFVGLAPDESSNHLIKRLIGVAGDHVTCCDALGRVMVNSVALDEGTYLYTDPATGKQVDPSTVAFDVVVPEGRIFVMGDHRNNSQDSRCHLADEVTGGAAGSAAFIPVENVVGTAVAVVFPFSRWGGFERPAGFAAIPSGAPAPAEPIISGPTVLC